MTATAFTRAIILICSALTTSIQATEAERVIVGHDVLSEEIAMVFFPVQEELLEYRKDFGSFPQGDNRTIMRCLCGLNPKQKIYVYLDKEYLFDGNGNLLDPWLIPYRFTYTGAQARVFSATCERLDTHPRKELFPGNARYPEGSKYPLPSPPTREILSRSYAYKLALCIRLLVQRRHELPPPKRLYRWLVNPVDKVWPRSEAGDWWPFQNTAEAKQGAIDPWGSPYVVMPLPGRVQVSSIHSAYIASEALPSSSH